MFSSRLLSYCYSRCVENIHTSSSSSRNGSIGSTSRSSSISSKSASFSCNDSNSWRGFVPIVATSISRISSSGFSNICKFRGTSILEEVVIQEKEVEDGNKEGKEKNSNKR